MWTGALAKGHGLYTVRPPSGARYSVGAHRLAWELLVGEIPDGLVLDHTCHTPACVNPWHLDPVPGRVNTSAGRRAPARTRAGRKADVCSRGHALTPENTYIAVTNRMCRTCLRDRRRTT